MPNGVKMKVRIAGSIQMVMYTTMLRLPFLVTVITCAYDWYFQASMLRLKVGEDYGYV
jgi:hypothetical protein